MIHHDGDATLMATEGERLMPPQTIKRGPAVAFR